MSRQLNNHPSAIQRYDWPLAQLPGLSHDNQSQLLECGITTTGQLIQKANTPETRQALANQLQIHIQYVKKWVALADLARIPSVGCQYCGLLLHAGVCSVTQLAQIPPHRLHQQILRLHVATMQRRDLCPSVEQVSLWIQQARSILDFRLKN
ncbi:DUF4332 domain-containing protein [Argonema antarcticum]|uniref:DUF4332 domain-containing protein n=1 Tax=Argonema antarcticum TaxID=2942763 RepID=UPI00201380F7|nr:DUF4332 domain-containing protein [Argonema antarcticum]MCL1474576.1 DUF4332 domain-containing protein [Argonema antarcticum A004/B2]